MNYESPDVRLSWHLSQKSMLCHQDIIACHNYGNIAPDIYAEK